MPGKRGRPTGFRLSEETREKIRQGRLGQLHSEETRQKIAATMNNGRSSILVRFVEFATMYIIRARRTANCNPIMQDIIDVFCEQEGLGKDSLNTYSVKYRVCLEVHGFISVANVNTIDRRLRFINPTPLFPASPGASNQIRDLNALVVEYIRYIYRVKAREKSAQKGIKPNRRFKYNGI